MKESIRVQLVELDKPLHKTSMTEQMMEHERDQKLETSLAGQLRDRLTSSILGLSRRSDNLLASNCFDIEVPDSLHLSKIETRKLSKVD